MSRRESRASMGAARQNDALFEFENFKKKFLLANKHITKLNSTLSVRIEELNAQISTLYVENLRLRATEIALTSQLKREREKSRKVMADAEVASQNLTKHLTYLRESYNITNTVDTPPTPPSPRARRPVLNVNTSPTSPHFNRIARPPNIPGIYEEEEPSSSSSEENPKLTTPPRKKSKSKPRLSASKLPLPSRGPSPIPSTPQPPVSYNIEPPITSNSSKRKPSRRQSGLLTINTEALSVPRSGSPAFGSPIRLEAGRAEGEEEFAVLHGTLEVEILERGVEEETTVKKEKRKGKAKEQRESESEKDGTVETAVRPREMKRVREEDGSETAKFKQKDISAPRTALQPIDNNVVHEQSEPDTNLAAASNRQFLRPPSPSGSMPHSHGSSSPGPANSSETDGTTGGRERRTRKSVNYAEPKLNTKMRKPGPAPGSSDSTKPKKRSSAAAVMSTTTYKSPDVMDMGNEADADTEARSSLEILPVPPPPSSGFILDSPSPLLLRGGNGDYISPELFPLPASRPGSAAAMYSPGPLTRTSGSTTSSSSTNVSNTTAIATSSSSPSLVSQAIKRQKSGHQLLLSDSESDGADADAEYVSGRGGSGSGSGSHWVNVEGRRKALPKRNAAMVAVTAIEDIRRHSLAY